MIGNGFTISSSWAAKPDLPRKPRSNPINMRAGLGLKFWTHHKNQVGHRLNILTGNSKKVQPNPKVTYKISNLIRPSPNPTDLTMCRVGLEPKNLAWWSDQVRLEQKKPNFSLTRPEPAF
jgi:hypothetical protein